MAKIVHMGMRADRPRQAQDATASNEQRTFPAQGCTGHRSRQLPAPLSNERLKAMLLYSPFIPQVLGRAACLLGMAIAMSTSFALAQANGKTPLTSDVVINQCLKPTPYRVQRMRPGNNASGHSILFEGRYQWIAITEEVNMEIVSKKSQDAIADVSVSWPSDMPGNKKKFDEQKDLRERYISAIGSSEAFSAKRTQLGDMSVTSLTPTDSQAMEGAPIGSTLVSSPSEMMFVAYNWKRLPDQKRAVDFETTRDAVLARTMECIRAAFPS
jgi:hypothetical protein